MSYCTLPGWYDHRKKRENDCFMLFKAKCELKYIIRELEQFAEQNKGNYMIDKKLTFTHCIEEIERALYLVDNELKKRGFYR